MIARVFDDDYSMYYCTLCSRPMKELHQANEHEKYCGKAVPMPTPEHEAMSRASSLISRAKLTDKQREERIDTYFPQRKPWVGLTPEEILDLFDVNNVYGSKWIEFARAIEAALKKKNT